MEMYTGAEHRATETHMLSGTTSNSHPTFLPHLEEIGYMSTEMAPEFVVDQGIYYPAANYYGYYSTGFESSGEWDDPNRFLGLDGQDIHYSGLQTESLPYGYYTPDYGYAQSPYNPYNPYIPGAVIGYDAPYIGTQPYFSSPSYQPPAYIPVVVQPGSDAVANNNMDPSLFGSSASMASAHVNTGRKYTAPLASNFTAANSQRPASGNLTSEKPQSSHSSAKSSEGPLINPPQNRQSSSYGAISLGSAAQVPQVRNLPGSAQVTHQFSQRVPSFQNPLKVATPSNDGFSHFGSNARGWSTVDRFRPRFQFDGVVNNPNGGSDVLGEQNRGPRTSRSKGQWTPVIADGGYPSKVATGGIQRSMLIDVDLYNRGDFPVNYSNARFFVIKSYSEDDVHKSIKYNVWSSTPNGNKKLDNAYVDTQRISVGKPRNCPIFLFFSVNASGQFCGVSEMIGPVDFHKDMDFWQQDKWTGSFPVKWHIIKDVPNTSFRHIILENNENKPVTNSRDTQEILYLPGMNMLNIFKSSMMKTSILDDFPFYEDREKFMQEEKCRLLGRSYDSCKFLAAFVPDIKTDTPFIQPPEGVEEQSSRNLKEPLNDHPKPTKDGGEQFNDTVDQPLKSNGEKPNGYNDKTTEDGKQSNSTVNQAPKINIVPSKTQRTEDQHPVAGRKDPKGTDEGQHPRSDNTKDPKNTVKAPVNIEQVTRKPKDTGDEHPIAERNDPKCTGDQPIAVRKDSKSTGDDEHLVADKNQGKPKDLKGRGKAKKPYLPGGSSILNSGLGLSSIDPKEGEASSHTDTVTVGSMLIRVNGASSSSGVITVGSIPIESKSSKHKGTLGTSRLLQK